MVMTKANGIAVIAMLLFLETGSVKSVWARNADKTTGDKTEATKTADNGKKEDEKSGASANVVPTTNAPSPAVENEIEQLREELSAQQALLQAQQARIAQLEIQLHVGQAQPAGLASTDSSESVLVAGSASLPAAAIRFNWGATRTCCNGSAKSTSVGRYAEARRAAAFSFIMANWRRRVHARRLGRHNRGFPQ